MKVIQTKQILILFICVFGFLFTTKAQELVKEKFYSNSVQDSIDIKIWLPKNYDSQKSYPVIYEFVYDHTDYIAATLNHIYECPSTIVVHADFYPGTSYDNPALSAKGEKYYQFVKAELIPHIKKKYKTLHSNATGLSQGADYVNYILMTNPELFDAYMIFAIESPNYKPDFIAYTNKLKEKKDYFIAVANDVERRVKYAEELNTNLSENENLNVEKKEYKNADHSYGMLYGLVDGLLFIYRDFVSYRKMEKEESFSHYFFNVVDDIENKYGTPFYVGLIIQTFTQLTKESPKEDIQTVLDKLFQDEVNISELDLFNIGNILSSELNYHDLSATAFEESIKRGKTKKVGDRKMNLSNTYSWLANTNHKLKNNEGVLSTLEEGFENTQDEYLLSRFAQYANFYENEKDIKKAIKHLLFMLALPESENPDLNPKEPKQKVYLLLSQSFWKLKNIEESKKYLNKSLEIDPEYESALEFQKSIQ